MTERGEFALVVAPEDAPFISFQTPHRKRQYYYPENERERIIERVGHAVEQARKSGHVVHAMGLGDVADFDRGK